VVSLPCPKMDLVFMQHVTLRCVVTLQRRMCVVLTCVLLLGQTGYLCGQSPEPGLPSEKVKSRKLVVAGGGRLPKSVYAEFRRLAGEDPRLVVIPTASTLPVDLAATQSLWAERGFETVQVLHTRDREVASSAKFCEPLGEATAVWFSGGSQQRIADAYLGTAVEKAIHECLHRGVVIGGTSAGAAIQTRTMIAGGRNVPELSKGLDLLPNAIVDQHFLWRNRLPRLIEAVRQNPNLVGIGIDEGTALVVEGEKQTVAGESYVMTVRLVSGDLEVNAFHRGQEIRLD